MAKKIYLAPSNQNANMYYGGKTNEAEQCRKVATALEKLLAKYDCAVKTGKDSERLSTKCANAKAWGADIYVSIHSNGANGKARGTECWYCHTGNRAAKSKKLAQLINNEMAKIFTINRGLKQSNDLIDCYMPAMPSTICEMGFHDNKEDAEIIINGIDELAQAFCTAIVKYLDLSKKDISTDTKKEETKKEETKTEATKTPTKIKVGDEVKVKSGAKDYNGTGLADFVYENTYDVIEVSGERVVIGKGKAVTAAMDIDNLTLASTKVATQTPTTQTPTTKVEKEKAKDITVGSTVKLKKGAKDYNGTSLASYVYERNHKVMEISGDRVVITYNDTVVAAVKKSDLTLV